MLRTSLAASIREGIRVRIASGDWTDQIPSEPELVKIFGASRETVRKALAALEAEGLLYRIHGKGTFVESAVSFNPLSGALSITEELSRSRLSVKNTVLDSGWIQPDEIPSALLRGCFEDATQVFRVRRLRLVKGQRLAVEVSYFRESDFPDLESADLGESLHRLMTTRYGLSPDRVQNRLHALDARRKEDREAAQVLGTRQALCVERALSRKRHVYYGVSFFIRTDLYPLEFSQLPARSGGGVL